MSAAGRRLAAGGRRSAAGAEAAWELPPGPLASGQARRALSGWLAGAGIDPGDGPGFDVVLAAAELAANAGVHGLPPVLLTARLSGDADGRVVTVRVSDAGTRPVRPVVVSPLAEQGRGLAIVAALALRWGTGEVPGGKEAWFEIAVPALAAGESSGRAASRNGPFGMNDELSPAAARREALAS